MKAVAFDLETIANPAMIAHLPPIEPNPRLKDPEKIKADIEEKKLKQLEEMGADKFFNLVCCASFKDMETGEVTSYVLDESMDERPLIEKIWKHLWQYKRFITFNGMEFDVPILIAHAAIHEVAITVEISTRKYVKDNHIDIRMILANWDKYARGTFDFFCRLFLMEGKPSDIDGSMVQHYWDCGLISKIKAYCEDDVDKLSRLYNRLKGYYW
jgi:predicted PolB exonuclease-like 3'-5' exonuclease